MGFGIKHTPLYVPDPRDPEDVRQHILGHTVTGIGLATAARIYAGSWPAGGMLPQLYHALLSPAHVGARYAGTNALADTVYAMRVYSTPFRMALSAATVPLAVAGTLGIVALQTEAMQEFTPQEQIAILSGVPQPGSSQKQKLMTLSGL